MPSESALVEAPRARQRILQTAGRLFYAEGFRAVGVDRVIAEADVAKATFYKHFPAKEDLIVAWIAAAEAAGQKAQPALDLPEPLTAYAEALIALARRPECLGCMFQSSVAEYAAAGNAVHEAAVAVKRRVLAAMEARAEVQGLKRPRPVAEAVFLFIEGVWASRRMFGAGAPLGHADQALRALIAGMDA